MPWASTDAVRAELDMPKVIRVADEVWTATASLHRRHPERADFTVDEIVKQAETAGVTGITPLRPGVRAHVELHCVANRAPRPRPVPHAARDPRRPPAALSARRSVPPPSGGVQARAEPRGDPGGVPGTRRLVRHGIRRFGGRHGPGSRPCTAGHGEGGLGGRNGRCLRAPPTLGLAMSGICRDGPARPPARRRRRRTGRVASPRGRMTERASPRSAAAPRRRRAVGGMACVAQGGSARALALARRRHHLHRLPARG